MPSPRIIIVTGANRGIGRAICQSLLCKPDISPLRLLATTRKGEDLAFESTTKSGNEVEYPQLDISSRESVRDFADAVSKRHGAVDVLINNAGINFAEGEYGPDTVRRTLDVNYRGTLMMCQSLLPCLENSTQRGGGRIVNLSSVASSLKLYSETIRARLRDPDLTFDGLEQLAEQFESSIHRAPSENPFGPDPIRRTYNFSKACINALTRMLARDNPGLTINACCPGWVATDMGVMVGRAPKTPEQGARIPVRLAVEDLGGVSGAYWANDGVRSKDDGKVQEW